MFQTAPVAQTAEESIIPLNIDAPTHLDVVTFIDVNPTPTLLVGQRLDENGHVVDLLDPRTSIYRAPYIGR